MEEELNELRAEEAELRGQIAAKDAPAVSAQPVDPPAPVA
jgi:ribosomal protein L29